MLTRTTPLSPLGGATPSDSHRRLVGRVLAPVYWAVVGATVVADLFVLPIEVFGWGVLASSAVVGVVIARWWAVSLSLAWTAWAAALEGLWVAGAIQPPASDSLLLFRAVTFETPLAAALIALGVVCAKVGFRRSEPPTAGGGTDRGDAGAR